LDALMNEPIPEISVVLPAHNEAGNVGPMAATLERVLKAFGRTEIVFVDDGSSDGTLTAIRAAAIAMRADAR
jgi:dolichol-phosphate mannosyltransferase